MNGLLVLGLYMVPSGSVGVDQEDVNSSFIRFWLSTNILYLQKQNIIKKEIQSYFNLDLFFVYFRSTSYYLELIFITIGFSTMIIHFL